MVNILILISGHLCNAPRPQKEAETLANAGYNVTVRGFWFDPKLIERDRNILINKSFHFSPIIDFQPTYRFTNLKTRIQSRFAKVTYRYLGIFSPNLLGYGVLAMLKVARQAKADLTIVHSEAGLWIGSQLLDEGFLVGVDYEDWFSEDLLPEARINRPIAKLKELEKRLIQTCPYCLTTSYAMAEAMASAYQAPKPTAIYNSFPWAERNHLDRLIKDRKNLAIPSLHWFSQTIGPGRGLEILFQALNFLDLPVEIHLRGNYSDSARKWLEALIPKAWCDRIFIHATVPNAELLSRIAEHDIGLALEIPFCLSRQFTITNKLFQYLQAGLAIVATDTDGQKEIMSQYPRIGYLISPIPEDLANALNKLLSNPERLAVAKNASLQAAKEKFSWEYQTQAILERANLALNRG
ncbi:glycosyltransferase [Tumidithrix elongata RA019]|uniref:Glycosyltransferase n=1 Tax=Tumidithrix elongata BACA0141 TaxID=2716417 RepID=A0AAW9PW96_9CYAN|nr:glycosyltransferase [Tumidithrix elongata RA019]